MPQTRVMDRAQLADFLRRRREALQPEDVGLRRGSRRRTAGLRREEVAALCDMSTDYYSRLEQARGPQPSEQMLAAIARGLRLTLDERDHLFRLAGHTAPDPPRAHGEARHRELRAAAAAVGDRHAAARRGALSRRRQRPAASALPCWRSLQSQEHEPPSRVDDGRPGGRGADRRNRDLHRRVDAPALDLSTRCG